MILILELALGIGFGIFLGVMLLNFIPVITAFLSSPKFISFIKYLGISIVAIPVFLFLMPHVISFFHTAENLLSDPLFQAKLLKLRPYAGPVFGFLLTGYLLLLIAKGWLDMIESAIAWGKLKTKSIFYRRSISPSSDKNQERLQKTLNRLKARAEAVPFSEIDTEGENSSLLPTFGIKNRHNPIRNVCFPEPIKLPDDCQSHKLNGRLHHPDQPAKTIHYPNGGKSEEYYLHGERHRLNGPAIIALLPDGSKREEYWLNDKRHREDGPARIITKTDGTVRVEHWQHMRLHCEHGPAVVDYNASGVVASEEYWINDKRHAENGPAIAKYDAQNLPVHEEFWQNGQLLYVEYNIVKDNTLSVDELFADHASHTRARMAKLSDGRTEEIHCRKGKLHRDDGPARIITTAQGKRFEEFWVDGAPLKLDLRLLPSLRKDQAAS